eukprot:CAMPEP_0194596500 /NCGR_PEP_ID=MMETSP0292-20121207/25701_1 /TAXON_ID=39354 /ORGANISM="Heterosigma akashiwo, Strain CCMP2393" /LENGTH=211 /DNA_ID=CAMNT_0039456783 /DNA_START=117 /DNA_END=748 /DNA_ORIENTATION=+
MPLEHKEIQQEAPQLEQSPRLEEPEIPQFRAVESARLPAPSLHQKRSLLFHASDRSKSHRFQQDLSLAPHHLPSVLGHTTSDNGAAKPGSGLDLGPGIGDQALERDKGNIEAESGPPGIAPLAQLDRRGTLVRQRPASKAGQKGSNIEAESEPPGIVPLAQLDRRETSVRQRPASKAGQKGLIATSPETSTMDGSRTSSGFSSASALLARR